MQKPLSKPLTIEIQFNAFDQLFKKLTGDETTTNFHYIEVSCEFITEIRYQNTNAEVLSLAMNFAEAINALKPVTTQLENIQKTIVYEFHPFVGTNTEKRPYEPIESQ